MGDVGVEVAGVQGGATAAGPRMAHLVQFYESEDVLSVAVAKFLKDGLAAGDVLTVIATEGHARAFQAQMEAAEADVVGAISSGQIVFLDAEQMLSRFIRGDEPDADLFHAEVGGLVTQRAAFAQGRPLRAYGEMVDLLWKRGQRHAALRLEELWNELQTRHDFTLFCAYAMGAFYKEPAALHGICGTHTHVMTDMTDRGGPRDGDETRDGNVSSLSSQYVHTLAREIVHRLEVEGALRDSLHELRQRENALHQSEGQLQSVTDALPALVSYVDTAERYQFVSAAYERWFGRPKTEFVGRRVEEVIGATAYEAVRPHVQRALAGHAVTYQAELPYRDGGTRFVEATYTPQFTEDGRVSGFVGMIGDISERNSFERFRADAAARAERLVRITAAIADAVTASEVLEAVVDHVARAVGASSAALWLIEEDGRTAKLARSVGYAEAVKRSLECLPLDLEPSMPVLDAIRQGAPLWIPSREALLRRYPHLGAVDSSDRGYRAFALPLVSQGRILGALGITMEKEREPEEDERDFLLLVARYAGQAIERLRLLDAERRSRETADAAAARLTVLSRENVAARARAEQLYHFAKVVESAERVEDVFEAALDAIEGALGTNRGAILTYDDSQVMRFRASRHLSEDYRRRVEGHSPWAPDAVAPQPVLVSDAENDAAWEEYRALFRREGIGSLAFIPLVTRGRLIGKFMVYYGQPHAYSTTEIELATAIANHLASVAARFSATAKLEETVRYNDLFAGVLAHDLRNPLSAMMTAAQLVLMRREGQGDSNAKPVSRIIASGQRMTRMIEQLLDLTRARVGGGIQVDRSETNLVELCDQAVGEIELTHPLWRIIRDSAGDLSGSWDGDRIMQIISNLVSNAGQHGKDDGGISIRLDGRRTDEVTLQVHNEGTVPEAVLPHLFDPFRGTRLHRGYSRGLGLGLFIVREIARAHGGSVEVISTEAGGTTFSVCLPRRASLVAKGAPT